MNISVFQLFLFLLFFRNNQYYYANGDIRNCFTKNAKNLKYIRNEKKKIQRKTIKKGNTFKFLFLNNYYNLFVTKRKSVNPFICSSPLFNTYDAKDIVILEGLEAVRKRPGMYIGNTDVRGLHQILFEIIDNSVDEYVNYECDQIKIIIHKDESITVEDNGRGIPCDIHHKTNKSALETVVTVLHSGAKFQSSETDEEVKKEDETGEIKSHNIRNADEETKKKRKKIEKEKTTNEHSVKYKYSSGLHGVGLSVTNALSSFMKVRVFRNNKMYSIELEKGKVVKPFQVENCSLKKRGTQIHYKPDHSIFKSGITHNRDLIKNRLHQLAYLNSRLTFLFSDERKDFLNGNAETGREKSNSLEEKNEYGDLNFYHYEVIKHEGGLNEYLEHITKNKSNLFKDNKIISISCFQKNIHIDLKMKWLNNYAENILSFVNNVYTIDGGSHVDALKTAITKCVNMNIKKKEMNRNFVNVPGEYIREGLTAILSIKMDNPEFEGQTKNKLGSNYLKPILETIFFEKLSETFDFEPQLLNTIYLKALQAKSSDEEAKAARDLIRSKNNQSYATILPGKLVDCISDDVERNEIFIVEGDSAAGSAKQARDREIQAILPLKGKILNVEKIKNNKRIFENSELKSLITAIGLSVNYDSSKSGKSNGIFLNSKMKKGNKKNIDLNNGSIETCEFENNGSNDLCEKKKKDVSSLSFIDKKLRYGKIIIMTDADVDGEHIRILLLTFLYRFQKEIIEKGNVYIACPPLYKITYDKFYDSQIKQLIMKQFNTTMKNNKCIIHTYSDNELKKLLKLLDADEEIRQKKLVQKKKDIKYEEQNVNNNENIENFYDTNESVTDSLNRTEKMSSTINSKSDDLVLDESSLIDDKTLYKVSKKYEIQRFKGLGEMMADQLWNTTMNPQIRKLIRVTINDAIKANELIFSLMGEDSKLRKRFILENSNMTLL